MESKFIFPICFWCGQTHAKPIRVMNAGNLSDSFVVNYDPCPECLIKWSNGRVFIEFLTEQTSEFQPGLAYSDGSKIFPSGRMCTLRPEQAASLFGSRVLESDESISFLEIDNFEAYFINKPVKICFWCNQPFEPYFVPTRYRKSIADYNACNACMVKWSGQKIIAECDWVSERAIKDVYVTCDGLPMCPTGRIVKVAYAVAEKLKFADMGEQFSYMPVSKFKMLCGETPRSAQVLQKQQSIVTPSQSALPLRKIHRQAEILSRCNNK